MHQRLSPYSRLPRLALACGAIVWAFPETHAMVPQRIAVCELGQHEDTPRLGAHCTDALRREGHTTTRLDPASLSNTDVLSPAHLDCVVLLRSSKIPAAAAKPLSAFARAGGDLVLLGGDTFTNPVIHLDGEWLTQGGLAQRLDATETDHQMWSFTGTDASTWKRNTNHPERPTAATIEATPGGHCLRLDIRGYGRWNWDLFSARPPAPPPSHSNVLRIRIRVSDPRRTTNVMIGITEMDGSRWRRFVQSTAEWQEVGIHEQMFTPVDDRTRDAQAGKSCQLSRMRELQIGLAGNDCAMGDHTIRVDSIGLGSVSYARIPSFAAELELGIGDTIPANDLTEITAVETAQNSPFRTLWKRLPGAFTGRSEFPYPLVNKSEFYPLLQAVDRHGRWRGWAAGLLANYGGPFTDSHWMVCGIREDAFYLTAEFADFLPQAIGIMAGKSLTSRAQQANETRQRSTLGGTSPAPASRISVSPDRKHLIAPDGNRFFMVGANYLGPSDRKCHFSEWAFDPVLVETDFRKAKAAGINCLRLWAGHLDGSPELRSTFLELARRYGIHLLVHCGGHKEKTIEELRTTVRRFAIAYGNDPMVIGFDLRNEPYIGEVAALTLAGNPSPLLQLKPATTFSGQYDEKRVNDLMKTRPGWPKVVPWLGDDDRRHVYAALEILEKHGPMPFEVAAELRSEQEKASGSSPWKQVLAAVNETFEIWIREQADVIRKEVPDSLVTVGYNTALGTLPANDALDFLSHHSYGHNSEWGARDPDPRYRIRDLAALKKLFPNKPITLGEFGYSNGNRVAGQFLSQDDSGLGEMVHYLQSLALGLDGAMKWCLTDWSVHATRDVAPWITPDQRIPNSGYGIYRHDGTADGRPKPIAPALRVLRKYVNRGGLSGELTVVDAPNQVRAGYVFRGQRALFVGNTSFEAANLRFTAAVPTNVLLLWGKETLELTATADCSAAFRLQQFVPGLLPAKATMRGRVADSRNDREWVHLGLLRGETVHFSTER